MVDSALLFAVSAGFAVVMLAVFMSTSGLSFEPVVSHIQETRATMQCAKLKGWAFDDCILEIGKRR